MENEKKTYPEIGGLYRHFKGMMYQVIAVAKHSETMEELVVYQALYGQYGVFVRPLDMFMSDVDHAKYPEVTQKKRFERVDRGSLPGGKGAASAAYSANAQAPKAETETTVKTAPVAESAARTEQALEVNDAARTEQASVATGAAKSDAHEDLSGVNPDLLAFLDARTNAEKLKVLIEITGRMDDRLLNSIEASLDIPGSTGTVDERIGYVSSFLRANARYETDRLR